MLPLDIAAVPTQPLPAPFRRPSPAELAQAAYPPGTPLPSLMAARAARAERARAVRMARRSRLFGWIAAVLALCVVLVPAGPSKNDLYAAAAAARAAWRYDRALALYQQAAHLDPDDPHPQCLIAEVLALQRLYAASIAAYTRCQALGASGPDVWLARGDVARDGGDVAGAERSWLRAAALGSFTARRRLGTLYESQGRFDDAQAQWSALAEAQRQAPGTANGEAEEHLGLLALRVADYDAARAHLVAARELPGFFGQDAVDQGFVQLAAQAPTDAAGLTQVGVSFVRAGLPTFARMPLEQAIALNPSIPEAHAYLAWVDWLAGQTAACVAEVTIARTLNPVDSFTLFIAAELSLSASRWAAASSELDLALAHDGKNPVLWAERGRAQEHLANYIQAELSYEQAASLATDPQFTEIWLAFYVGHRYGLATGRAARAAVVASARWSDQAQVQELAGQIYELAGQQVTALAVYQRANTLDPSDPQPYFDAGRLFLAAGEYDTAALDLRTVIALRPHGPLAAKALALLAPIADFDI
jgi:tetratricopeptide (TPR) repeat protein